MRTESNISRLRLPRNVDEARQVFRRWDRLNGRYYLVADVVLDDGTYVQGMVFDGDTRVAVEANSSWVYERPELVGRTLVAALLTNDASGAAAHFTIPSEAERLRFREAHTGGETPA